MQPQVILTGCRYRYAFLYFDFYATSHYTVWVYFKKQERLFRCNRTDINSIPKAFDLI